MPCPTIYHHYKYIPTGPWLPLSRRRCGDSELRAHLYLHLRTGRQVYPDLGNCGAQVRPKQGRGDGDARPALVARLPHAVGPPTPPPMLACCWLATPQTLAPRPLPPAQRGGGAGGPAGAAVVWRLAAARPLPHAGAGQPASGTAVAGFICTVYTCKSSEGEWIVRGSGGRRVRTALLRGLLQGLVGTPPLFQASEPADLEDGDRNDVAQQHQRRCGAGWGSGGVGQSMQGSGSIKAPIQPSDPGSAPQPPPPPKEHNSGTLPATHQTQRRRRRISRAGRRRSGTH